MSGEASTSAAKPSPPPTTQMLAIDAVVQELSSGDAAASGCSSRVLKRNMCFCQGRKHALAPYAPLCYSCGLVLCSAIRPSPLSPLSCCPSCNATPLLSTAARSDLVVKLLAERKVLEEQQLLQIQIQREMKKLNKGVAASAHEEEAALFPRLGMDGTVGSNGHAAMPLVGVAMGKHGGLQKAKAMAGDAHRTAKVLSLDMKTHKVKTHTKVTRAKAVVDVASSKASAKAATTADEEQEVEQDAFVGLDGSVLVRDEADDGLSRTGLATAANARIKATKKGDGSMPSRTWTLKDQQLTLTPSVQSVP